jgi:nucleolar complex protein 3
MLFSDSSANKYLCRSKRETDRLHRLNKPVPRTTAVDNLPSIDSHSEDEHSWSSDLEQQCASSDSDHATLTSSGGDHPQKWPDDLDSDIEMPYEKVPRKRRPSWDRKQDSSAQRLPIKLPDGRIQKVDGNEARTETSNDVTDDSEGHSESKQKHNKRIVEDISTGARFGRPAVVDVIGNQSRKARIQAAKEEIAQICQDIVADPENGVSGLSIEM